MTLCYTLGSGWGHLERMRAVTQQLALHSFKVITNNDNASRFFKAQQVLMVNDNEPEDARWILANTTWDRLLIDTFPMGIQHELSLMDELHAREIHYLARRLKWSAYRQADSPDPTFRFHTCYLLEDLEEEHYDFVVRNSDRIERIAIAYPMPIEEFTEVDAGQRPLWVIMHTSHAAEVEILYQYAQDVAGTEGIDPWFLILSDQLIPLTTPGICICRKPSLELFEMADRIFTGGGYNTLAQTRDYRAKQVAIPFPRKYDDQFWRVSNVFLPVIIT